MARPEAGYLSLDTIISRFTYCLRKWTPSLTRTQAADLVRYLIYLLYNDGKGNLNCAQVIVAQTQLADKFHLSRQWVGRLLARIQEEGWLEYYAPTLPDGTNAPTIYRAGRRLKRMWIALLKSKQRKTPAKQGAHSSGHSFPTKVVRKLLSILESENKEPTPEQKLKMPLLETWMKRKEPDPIPTAA